MPNTQKAGKLRVRWFLRWDDQLSVFWMLLCVGSFLFGIDFVPADVALQSLGEASVTREALAITFLVWLICYCVLQLAQVGGSRRGLLSLRVNMPWALFRPWGVVVTHTNGVGMFCARASMFLSIVNVIAVGLFCALGSGELPYFDVLYGYKLTALFLLFISAWCSGASYLGFREVELGFREGKYPGKYFWEVLPGKIVLCKWIGMTAFCVCFLLIGVSGVLSGAYSSLK